MIRVYFCGRVPEKDKKADGISQHRLAYLLLEKKIRERWPALSGKTLVYEREAGGKPYLRDYPQIQFNLSHCPDCVACALGDGPVGIDVEQRFPWRPSLARRICHPREMEGLLSLEEEERSGWLNRIWSRKESCLKYLGTGIRRDLREILVWDKERMPEQGSGEILTLEGKRCWLREVQTERFTLTVCGEEPIREAPEQVYL